MDYITIEMIALSENRTRALDPHNGTDQVPDPYATLHIEKYFLAR